MTGLLPLNSQPRPRALFQDLDDGLAASLESLFPSIRRVTGSDVVHDDEFDVLVTTSAGRRRSAHLHVVSFGVLPDHPHVGGDRMVERLQWDGVSHAQELNIPATLDAQIRELVRRDLFPLLHSRAVKATVTTRFYDPGTRTLQVGLHPSDGVIDAFLLSGADGIVAGAYTQKDEQGTAAGRVWFLPQGLESPAAWVQLALVDFARRDPDRVPSLRDWWTSGPWATPAQASARVTLTACVARRQAVIAELDADVAAAEAAAVAADAEAKAGALRLLTADGEELEAAVTDALTSFGFDITVMDLVYPVGDRREDLQLRDPDVDGWLALVEIKGYSRGASVNDLARIERHTTRYAADHAGAIPTAKFHVVNPFKGTDPASRLRAIPNDDELREFAAGGGLLIETRDLFKAWCAIEEGALDPGEVRQSLREGAMRWVVPDAPKKGERS